MRGSWETVNVIINRRVARSATPAEQVSDPGRRQRAGPSGSLGPTTSADLRHAVFAAIRGRGLVDHAVFARLCGGLAYERPTRGTTIGRRIGLGDSNEEAHLGR